jgi:CDP-2,3-bis-(O-geranylgeranyl)-sn-glycerol synthase
MLTELLIGIWVIFPAWAANALAPLPKGQRRMDFGLKFFGQDLLGAGKTWEGFLFAVMAGTCVGFLQIITSDFFNNLVGFHLPTLSPLMVFSISFAAMIGDSTGSFIKRRFLMARGEPAPLLDQLDFVVGGFLAARFFLKIPLLSVVLVLIITPVLHYLLCFTGYKLGLKREPW